MEFSHKPVLLDECINGLNIKRKGTYVDGTLGGAGHSFEICKKLNNTGKLIGIDRDLDAINASKLKLKSFTNTIFINNVHENISNILSNLEISNVDGILIDLGVSSYQLDEASRGFSYMSDASLDMRMDRNQTLSAKEVVNNYSEQELTKIFFDFGEEKYSKRIAKAICEARKEKEIETTFELVNIIKGSLPKSALAEKQHPGKRIFQAIRIEVNGELVRLEQTIRDCIKLLNDKGRLAIITFHSLEDRIVKNTFLDMQGRCKCPKGMPICGCNYVSYGKVMTKHPITSSEEELSENPRARSAKLRIFERII